LCSASGDALRLVLLARLRHGDLLVLLGLGLGALLLEAEDRLVGREVLRPDLHALLLAELVGEHVLLGRDLGDLPDALRVQDVVRVERLERRLLEVVDRASSRTKPFRSRPMTSMIWSLKSRAPCRGPRSRAACRRS
jgi:hypothetical protein